VLDRDPLWELVREIPFGKCASYGDLGRALPHPTTGRIVGRWMASCPEDIPWWRVVAKSGALPLYNRSPHMGADQRSRLEEEGVTFKDEHVVMAANLWLP